MGEASKQVEPSNKFIQLLASCSGHWNSIIQIQINMQYNIHDDA